MKIIFKILNMMDTFVLLAIIVLFIRNKNTSHQLIFIGTIVQSVLLILIVLVFSVFACIIRECLKGSRNLRLAMGVVGKHEVVVGKHEGVVGTHMLTHTQYCLPTTYLAYPPPHII